MLHVNWKRSLLLCFFRFNWKKIVTKKNKKIWHTEKKLERPTWQKEKKAKKKWQFWKQKKRERGNKWTQQWRVGAPMGVCECACVCELVCACNGKRDRARKTWFTMPSAKNEAHLHCKTSLSFNLMSYSKLLKTTPGYKALRALMHLKYVTNI